jgi:tetratricopeptide (TPR) repeat protein
MQTAVKAVPAFPKSDEAGRFLSLVGAAKDEASATTAAAEAQKFLSTQSNYVPALMVSALAQQAQGKSDAASEIYNRVLTQFPMFTPAVRNLGLIYFARSNDDQKAYELLTKAREALPQDPDVAKALGVLSYRKGNYDRAAQLLKQSLQMRNQDAEALFYLGMSQFNLKFKSESKASLMKALDYNLPARLEEEAKRVLLQLK